MTESKIELLYCVMVVATGVVAGILKSSNPSPCIRCGVFSRS